MHDALQKLKELSHDYTSISFLLEIFTFFLLIGSKYPLQNILNSRAPPRSPSENFSSVSLVGDSGTSSLKMKA